MCGTTGYLKCNKEDSMPNIVTSRDEIIRLMLDRVKTLNPDASLLPGTPLYDLMVNRLADVIKEERDLINVLTNIARVVPMFDNEGALRPEYEDMQQHITDRFFLVSPERNEVWDTLYLVFNRKGTLVIESGSKVSFQDAFYSLLSVRIPEKSPLWKKMERGWSHPVQFNASEAGRSTSIPAGTQWGTGLVEYTASDFGVILIGGYSHKVINTDTSPEVTLDYLRNSISNRSWSNVRSIMYNLRSNTVFSPDELRKARVMHISEPAFIERRRVLYENEDHILDAIISGDGKVLMDYGTALRIKPVELGYVSRTSDIYSELVQVRVPVNPRSMIRHIQLDGVTHAHSDRGRLYGRLTQVVYGIMEDSVLTLELYRTSWEEDYEPVLTDRVAYGTEEVINTGTGENYRTVRFALNEDNSSGITGNCLLTFDKDYFNVDEGRGVFHVITDDFNLYRIDTLGLGLLSPVAVGSLEELENLRTSMEAFETDSAVPPYTRASAAYPAATVLPRGDVDGTILYVEFAPATPGQAALAWGVLNNKTLYWRIITGKDAVKRFAVSLDPKFRDPSKSVAGAVIPDDYSAGDVLTLETARDSFMKLNVAFGKHYDYIEDNTEPGNYLAAAGSFVRNSNEELVYTASTTTGVANAADGHTAYLLYYGTDPDRLERSQEAFLNMRHAEIGTRILVTPYRPVTFTLFYSPEYVHPFMKDRDYYGFPDSEELEERLLKRKTQFMSLLIFLEEEFSNYGGKISDIDFSELSLRAANATGMSFRKLDFTLATQRGYFLRGSIDVDLERSSYINWKEDIVDRISSEVDNEVQYSSMYVKSDERESLVTDETMYKPLLSRVWI